MNRTEFVIVTAAILMIAFALGWIAHLILQRFTRISGDLSEVDRLASMLHDAEEARDQALLYMEEREQQLLHQLHDSNQQLTNARLELEEMRAYVDRMHPAG